MADKIETDPTGRSLDDIGAKADNGKVMAGRLLGLFSHALEAVAEVGTFGANKYTEGGWQFVPDGIKRYEDAQMRHYLKRHQGDEYDEESGSLHAAHEAWNALAKLELMIREQQKEDACDKIYDSYTSDYTIHDLVLRDMRDKGTGWFSTGRGLE